MQLNSIRMFLNFFLLLLFFRSTHSLGYEKFFTVCVYVYCSAVGFSRFVTFHKYVMLYGNWNKSLSLCHTLAIDILLMDSIANPNSAQITLWRVFVQINFQKMPRTNYGNYFCFFVFDRNFGEIVIFNVFVLFFGVSRAPQPSTMSIVSKLLGMYRTPLNSNPIVGCVSVAACRTHLSVYVCLRQRERESRTLHERRISYEVHRASERIPLSRVAYARCRLCVCERDCGIRECGRSQRLLGYDFNIFDRPSSSAALYVYVCVFPRYSKLVRSIFFLSYS